jgi:hypothetical protein
MKNFEIVDTVFMSSPKYCMIEALISIYYKKKYNLIKRLKRQY